MKLWAQTDAGAKLDTVSLISYGQYEADFGFQETGAIYSRDRPGIDYSMLRILLYSRGA